MIGSSAPLPRRDPTAKARRNTLAGVAGNVLKCRWFLDEPHHGDRCGHRIRLALQPPVALQNDKNGWSYPSGATAKTLIKTVLDNGLVPNYMETHLAGLRATLEAGLPTVRNKNSGHGQGLLMRKVPDYLAGYTLHLAATNIVFLVQAHESLKRK
jgi:hypothetical protein